MKKAIAALSTAFFMSACSDVTLKLPELGVYDCHNVFDGRQFSFDTANKLRLARGFNESALIFEDINTGNNIRVEHDEGWVCTAPGGSQIRFDTNLSLRV